MTGIRIPPNAIAIPLVTADTILNSNRQCDGTFEDPASLGVRLDGGQHVAHNASHNSKLERVRVHLMYT